MYVLFGLLEIVITDAFQVHKTLLKPPDNNNLHSSGSVYFRTVGQGTGGVHQDESLVLTYFGQISIA